MQWIVQEYFCDGTYQDSYGPFPSQDQAMSYCEWLEAQGHLNLRFRVTQLHSPAFMPEKIHG